MSPEEKNNTIAYWLAMCWMGVTAFMQAHLIEDAFIPLRVVEQFWAGNGLVWNPGERVQVSTSLLWQILILPVKWIGDSPTGLLITCWLLTMGFFRVVINPKTPWPNSLVVAGFWTACLSFQEFMMCGLEGPMVALLAALTVQAQLNERANQIGLWSGLLAISRPDCILLAVPFWVANWKWLPRGMWLPILLAATPLGIQTIVTTIYFATPVPNTFWAKMAGEVEGTMENGLLYLIESLKRDPVAGLALLAGLGVAKTNNQTEITWICGSAITLYTGFILISADYMAGRFLLPILAFAMTLLGTMPIKPQLSLVMVVILALSLLKKDHVGADWSRIGIEKSKPCSIPQYEILGKKYANKQPFVIHSHTMEPGMTSVYPMIGMAGYFAPIDHYIIDTLALADPILSRLPGMHAAVPIPGHTKREIPKGYIQAREKGDARLVENAEVAHLVETQFKLNKLPLFSSERLQAIKDYLFFKAGSKTKFEQRFPVAVRSPKGEIYNEQGVVLKTDPKEWGVLTGSTQEMFTVTGLDTEMNPVWKRNVEGKVKLTTPPAEFIHLRPEQPGTGKGAKFSWKDQ